MDDCVNYSYQMPGTVLKWQIFKTLFLEWIHLNQQTAGAGNCAKFSEKMNTEQLPNNLPSGTPTTEV